MDYRFYYNERQLPCAQLSMDHEAFGLWLTDELSDDSIKLAEILTAISTLETGKQADYEWKGQNFLLRLTREDATVMTLELLQDHSHEELGNEEDLDFYDSESRADCGLEDFRDLLIEWQDFIEG